MDLLKKLVTGIYLVTVKGGKDKAGMVASWIMPVSKKPTLVAVGIRTDRYAHQLIEKEGVFGINILYQGQKELVEGFKGPLKDNFKEVEFFTGNLGIPLLHDSIGAIECKLYDTITPGDHTIFIGEVVETHFQKDLLPLDNIRFGKSYLG